MKAADLLWAFSLLDLALTFSFAFAYDPSHLQDICVATNNMANGAFVNGRFCKDPKLAKPEDFFFSGLDKPRNTANPLGINVTLVTVDQIPGLNTLGISAARLDLAPNGQVPPHTHPRASEIIVVLEGTLYVGFVTSNQLNNTLISKVLNKGDVFVFPFGLIHFQLNIGKTNAVAIVALSSQNPGLILIANSIFGAEPPINPDFLAKAFHLDPFLVKALQLKF